MNHDMSDDPVIEFLLKHVSNIHKYGHLQNVSINGLIETHL